MDSAVNNMVSASMALQQVQISQQAQLSVFKQALDGSASQIAALMEISVEAVESLTSRGKRALASILKGRKAALGFEGDVS